MPGGKARFRHFSPFQRVPTKAFARGRVSSAQAAGCIIMKRTTTHRGKRYETANSRSKRARICQPVSAPQKGAAHYALGAACGICAAGIRIRFQRAAGLGAARDPGAVFPLSAGDPLSSCDAIFFKRPDPHPRLRRGKISRGMHAARADHPPDDGHDRHRYGKGALFTGRFEEAYAALPRPAPAQAKASVLLAYDNVLFNSALATGRLDQARQVRAHAAALPAAKHKGMEKAAASLLDLMGAALAFEAGDYDAFRSKTQAFLLTANTPLQKVSSSYRLALADLKQGEWENARARLTFAAQHGGTLFFAAQAEALLRVMPAPADG